MALVQDAITSAFQSAGQRCSALRVAFLQTDVADKILRMLTGAMEELIVGDPALITVRTAALWAAVLTAVPNARLVLKDVAFGDEVSRERILDALAEEVARDFSGRIVIGRDLTEIDVLLD